MAGETVITVVGNLVDDPELRFTPSGAAVANFRIASTPRTFDKQTNEWKDGEALFLSCSIWRQAAENVAESLQKGMRVVVQGRLKPRSTRPARARSAPSSRSTSTRSARRLKYATAKVTRTSRSGGGGGYSGGGGGGGRPATTRGPPRPRPAVPARAVSASQGAGQVPRRAVARAVPGTTRGARRASGLDEPPF